MKTDDKLYYNIARINAGSGQRPELTYQLFVWKNGDYGSVLIDVAECTHRQTLCERVSEKFPAAVKTPRNRMYR